ncbi:META domain-containing protein [Streptomyces sp. SAS_270]|uniref:META domain-containing protein n=1 Tax=Streptomyces sp. SAS_270 TaxID=3412748 RepID=UPI00403C9054
MDRQRLTLSALTLTTLTVFPLAVACGNETGSTSVGAGTRSSVTGVHWTVDSVTVKGTSRKAATGANVEIGDDGKVQGNYGCNHFYATADFKGDRLDLGETQATEMACEEGAMKFEDTLARTLADGALTAEVGKNALTLTTDDGDRVHLTKEQDAPLHGTKWTITALGDADVAESLPEGAKAYLTVDAKGRLTGRLGCNDVTAKATVRDGHITLGAPATTRMMCDRSLMNTEKTLLGLFRSTVAYELDHRTLALTSTNGTRVTAVAER